MFSQIAKTLVQTQPELLLIRPFALRATYERLTAAIGGLRRHVFMRRCALLRMPAAELEAWVLRAKEVLGEQLARTALRKYPPLLLIPASSLAPSWSGMVEELGKTTAAVVVAAEPLVLNLDQLVPERARWLGCTPEQLPRGSF